MYLTVNVSIAHERVLRLLCERHPLLREAQVRVRNVEAEQYHLFLGVLRCGLKNGG